MLRFLLYTGARKSEVLRLKWEHFHGDRAVLPDSKTGPHAIWLAPCSRRGLAAPTALGCSLSAAAGLPTLRIHDLRHSHAAVAVNGGEGLHVVARLLGHADIKITFGYAHLAEDAVFDAALQGFMLRVGSVVRADIARFFHEYGRRKPGGANRSHEILRNMFDCASAKTGPRHVLLGESARELLNSLAETASGKWVFPSKSVGGPLGENELYWFWRRARDAAGVVADARLHDLRHVHASHVVMNGESLHVAGRLLGHRRATTTNRYVHLDDATLSQAAERVALSIHRMLFESTCWEADREPSSRHTDA